MKLLRHSEARMVREMLTFEGDLVMGLNRDLETVYLDEFGP